MQIICFVSFICKYVRHFVLTKCKIDHFVSTKCKIRYFVSNWCKLLYQLDAKGQQLPGKLSRYKLRYSFMYRIGLLSCLCYNKNKRRHDLIVLITYVSIQNKCQNFCIINLNCEEYLGQIKDMSQVFFTNIIYNYDNMS